MKYPPYQRYKDSGIDWLGVIPEHWGVQKFKYLFSLSSEKNGVNIIGEMLSVSGYRGIEIKKYEDENQKRTEEDLKDYRVVRVGQLAVNTMWLNYSGLGVSKFEGYVSPAYRVYSISDKLHSWFAHNLLRSSIYVSGYTTYLQGIRPNSLQIKTEDFQSFPVLIPPIEEQKAIAEFLDAEALKIDELISKQERLIVLLQEKRQALISHIITKGLNPNAPRKGSGIAWLGEIPEHYKLRQLKYLTYRIGDGIHSTPNYDDSSDIYFINGNNLNNGHVIYETARGVDKKDYKKLNIEFNMDTIFLSINGTIGNLAFYNGEKIVLGKSAAYIECRKEVDKQFAFYLFQSFYVLNSFELSLAGTTIKNLSLFTLNHLKIILPSVEEQKQIVKYLDRETIKIDALIGKARRAVALLQEHRATLISSAVTGKIDVRQVAMAGSI